MKNDDKLIEYALGSQEYIDQFIPIIKTELLNNDSLDKLIDKLQLLNDDKELELQDISFNSIDNITKSIEIINNIVKSSDQINNQLVITSKNISKSGKNLLEERKKILNINQIKDRINDINIKIDLCLDVLNTTNKILELVKSKDFYRSLILLKSLNNNNNLNELKNFEFINKFYNAIPSFELLIVDETFNQLNRWLNLNIEKNFTEFGELLFENFQLINDSWFEIQINNKSLLNYKVNSSVEKSFRIDELRTFNPLDKLNINLQPLLHSILVFKELNQLKILKDYLSNDIIRRIDHLFIPIKDSITKLNVFPSNESLKLNIYSIISFTIIDKLINEKINYQLRSIDEINETFNLILKKFSPILNNHIEFYSFEIDELIEINEIIGIYYQILLSNNFLNCQIIYEKLMIIFDKYLNKLVEKFKKDYIKISMNDNLQPIIISTEDEFNQLEKDTFYLGDIINNNNIKKFPLTIPISSSYLKTNKLLNQFINDIYEFISKYYIHDNNLIINKISKSIDYILTKIILIDLDDKIKSTYKEVVSQNLINLDYYLISIEKIENYLNLSEDNLNILRFRNFTNLIKFQSINEFKRSRKSAIESMFNMIDLKIFSLFDMVEFNWNSNEFNNQPNTNLIDLIGFLLDSFKLNFSHLPISIKSLLLLKIFDKISKFFNDSINESYKITDNSIKNFKIDVEYVQNSINLFFENENNVNIEPLKNLFNKLNQITDLLIDGNLEYYKNDEIRIRKFNKIEPEEAIYLLNKLKDDENNNDIEQQEESIDDNDDDDDTISIFGLKRSTTFFKKS